MILTMKVTRSWVTFCKTWENQRIQSGSFHTPSRSETAAERAAGHIITLGELLFESNATETVRPNQKSVTRFLLIFERPGKIRNVKRIGKRTRTISRNGSRAIMWATAA